MKVKDIIKQVAKKSESKIWTKYIRFILPIMLLLILGMNIAVYNIASSRITDSTREMVIQTVGIQSNNISNIIYRYIDDLNVLKSYYNPADIDGFIKKANETLYKHSNEWSYLRLSTPDGRTWTNYTGLDTVNVKIRKFYREIFIEKKEISFRMSHHTDVVESGDVFSVTMPIKDSTGSPCAALSTTFSTKKMDATLEKMKINGHGFVALIDENLEMRVLIDKCVNTNADKMEKQGYEGFYKLCEDFTKGYGGLSRGEYNSRDEGRMVVYFSKIKGTPWSVCINISNAVLHSSVNLTLKILLALAILTLLSIVICVKFVTNRYVISPLNEINRCATDFSQGRLYSVKNSSDTIQKKRDEFSELQDSLEIMQARFVEIIKNIKEYTEDFTESSMIWSRSVQNISADAKTQQNAVDEISVSIDQIISSIKETNEKTQKTKEYSESISNDIQEVTKSSENSLIFLKNVLTKIKIINEITTSTDILAINAAVEASRAGENGKGFAVVASEIRKLSERCQMASADINHSSAESLDITRHAVELIDKISPRVREMAAKIAEISEICFEQLSKTVSIHSAVTKLAEITANNRYSADEIAKYSSQIKSKLAALNSEIDFFKVATKKKLKRPEIISQIESHTHEILKLKATLAATVEDAGLLDDVNNIISTAISEASIFAEENRTENKDEDKDAGFGIFEDEKEVKENGGAETADKESAPKGVIIDLGNENGNF